MKSNKKLGSYPGILITASLTLALFLIGFCGWVAFSSKELISYIKQNIEVQAYLDRGLTAEKIDFVKKTKDINTILLYLWDKYTGGKVDQGGGGLPKKHVN